MTAWLRNCRRRAKDNLASPDSRLRDQERQVRNHRGGRLKFASTNESEIGHSGFILGASVPPAVTDLAAEGADSNRGDDR